MLLLGGQTVNNHKHDIDLINYSWYVNDESAIDDITPISNIYDDSSYNSECNVFTTGVLSRAKRTQFIRIAWVNLGNNTEFPGYKIYDWSNGTPILLKEDIVQLDPIESKITDFKIVTTGYGDCLDVKLYEIRLCIICRKKSIFGKNYKENIIANIFGISDNGVNNEGNTVLYSQLINKTD